jgi:hypothetical protein
MHVILSAIVVHLIGRVVFNVEVTALAVNLAFCSKLIYASLSFFFKHQQKAAGSMPMAVHHVLSHQTVWLMTLLTVLQMAHTQ